MRAPAVLVAIPLALGAASGLLTAEPEAAIAVRAAAAALVAWTAAASAISLRDGRMSIACVVVGSLLAGLSLGHSSGVRAYRSPLEAWFSKVRPRSTVILRGVLREDAALAPAGVSLFVDVSSVDGIPWPDAGAVRLTVVGTLAARLMREWSAGRTVQVPATLRRPAVYKNPGVTDDTRSLQRRGISLVGSVKSGALVEISGRGSFRTEKAAGVRAVVRDTLAQAVGSWSTRSAGVATAILIGDRTGLDEQDEQRLLRAGTYHVIAISGGNIAILTIAMLGALRWISVSPRLSAAAAIVVLLLYGQIAGSAASVQRAIAAAIVYLIGRLLEHRTPPLNVLGVAGLAGLGWAPAAILDPGFLLSFGATLGILMLMPRGGSRLWSVTPSFAAPVASLLAATIAVDVVLAPLSAALFGRLTCAGLVLNVAAVPLMAVVQIGSMAVLALAPISAELARSSGLVVHLAAAGLIDSARLVEIAPWMVREVSPPAWWLMAAYYGSVGAALISERARRLAIWAALACALAIVAGPHSLSRDGVPAAPAGHMRLVFLDVGQGDATLLQLPDRRALLVDAGGLPSAPLQDARESPGFDIGDRVVSRALRALGVRRLDAFVLTHADADHLGGANSVVRAFRPRAFWEGIPVPPHGGLRDLGSLARRLEAEWRPVQAGERVRFGDVEILTLHPPRPDWERQRVRNDDSVVLDVRYGDVSIILPGDIGRQSEAALLTHAAPAPLVILKAPHHGSATSSSPEFLSRLRPRAVIFSAGRDNHFNHPAPAVVSRYRALHADIFSTADDGAVLLETDGRSVLLRGWEGRTTYYRVP